MTTAEQRLNAEKIHWVMIFNIYNRCASQQDC